MDCKTSFLSDWDKSGKAPTITSANIPSSNLLDQFLDQFDSITTKINVTVMASLSAYSVTEPLGLTLGVNAH